MFSKSKALTHEIVLEDTSPGLWNLVAQHCRGMKPTGQSHLSFNMISGQLGEDHLSRKEDFSRNGRSYYFVVGEGCVWGVKVALKTFPKHFLWTKQRFWNEGNSGRKTCTPIMRGNSQTGGACSDGSLVSISQVARERGLRLPAVVPTRSNISLCSPHVHHRTLTPAPAPSANIYTVLTARSDPTLTQTAQSTDSESR